MPRKPIILETYMQAKTILNLRTSILLALLAVVSAVHAQYAQQGELTDVFDAPHIISYVVAGLMITLFVQFFRNRLFVFREKDVNAQYRNQNAQLALVLQTCKVKVWTMNPKTLQFRLLGKKGTVENEYSPMDFSQFFESEGFERLRECIREVHQGKMESATIVVPGHSRRTDKRQRQLEINIQVLERDAKNQPVQILGMQRDITDELEKKSKVSQLLMQYHTVFNQALIDMVYYDANGVLVDINDKACETFGIKDRQAFLAQKPTIDVNPGFKESGFDGKENLHFTALIDKEDLGAEQLGIEGREEQHFYYEMLFAALHNAQGELTGIFTSGRNVTEMVENHHRQQEDRKKLAQATKSIQEYIQNINYALQVSGVMLMNYHPDRHVLEVSSNLNQTQYRLSQLRSVDLVAPEHQAAVKRIFRQMDQRRDIKIRKTIRTIIFDGKDRDTWLSLNILPIYTPDGKIDHYFGMCRNETEMVATEQQLTKETEKAQEAELLKTSFLTNMSYELRTPLNAVLGFAELLSQEHDTADEAVFVEEIKKNSNTLLALVNDALFLSRLDAHMVEFKHEFTDFAILFEGHCQLGWTGTLKPGVTTLVENPYNSLMVKIDAENLGQVLQKVCANAAYSTSEGFIRAKYEYRRGELNITIEDTGMGMDDEALKNIFGRFVTKKQSEHEGTGLTMPIVKELVEQMGGIIDVSSEKGKGTTTWITIPCELGEFDKKRDTLV